jgi:2-oxoglutarate ferredoxin oxidoreductase subunit delta
MGRVSCYNTRMSKIRINVERCKGCGLCVGVCPQKHLEMGEELNQAGYTYAKMIEGKKCTACGLCYRMCPDVVIEVEGKE